MNSIDIAYIPPEQFPTKRWWKPVRTGNMWFYHSPAPFRGANFLRDYSTVDPSLRPITKMLHAMGIPTLPSCEGHWPRKSWVKDCFIGVQSDAQRIRGEGVTLEDVETGSRLRLCDPYWQLPWFTWEDMYEELWKQRGLGYLAFMVPPNSAMQIVLPELRGRLAEVQVTGTVLQNKLHAVITVQARTPMAQAACWGEVGKVLSRAR